MIRKITTVSYTSLSFKLPADVVEAMNIPSWKEHQIEKGTCKQTFNVKSSHIKQSNPWYGIND
jgi:hypothetical protein